MTGIKTFKCLKSSSNQGFWSKNMTTGESYDGQWFVSQETEMENGKEVFKWVIFVAFGHPEMKKLEESRIGIEWFDDEDERKHSYEISFVDGEKGWVDRKYPHYAKNKRIRYFIEAGDNITIIKDNSYTDKLEELKTLNDLIPGEEQKWRSFIKEFQERLDRLTNQDVSKYQKGKKFIDELEAELNKKTGKKDKNNKDDEQEREREQIRTRITELEAIANRTAEQEQELKEKKEELARLEKEKQEQNSNKTNWTPLLIGGGIILILIMGIIAFLWKKQIN